MGVLELLVLLAAVGGSSVLVGTVAWLWYRTKRLEDRILRQGERAPDLVTEIRDLRRQLQASDEDVGQLRERLDFLEKLLHEGGRDATRRLESPPGAKSEQ
jgi:hypothetical protein